SNACVKAGFFPARRKKQSRNDQPPWRFQTAFAVAWRFIRGRSRGGGQRRPVPIFFALPVKDATFSDERFKEPEPKESPERRASRRRPVRRSASDTSWYAASERSQSCKAVQDDRQLIYRQYLA
ncbi:hypothetical protein, partial [uncultured Desulfovibrio sp.]|uniref:hypothetical protein n=1 Tax=uncultured Desulfovibrio sp. TaxID=167968 RepID=UPI0026152BAC